MRSGKYLAIALLFIAAIASVAAVLEAWRRPPPAPASRPATTPVARATTPLDPAPIQALERILKSWNDMPTPDTTREK